MTIPAGIESAKGKPPVTDAIRRHGAATIDMVIYIDVLSASLRIHRYTSGTN